MNRLYYGDNLTIMREMPLRSVDLIYLDPPFNSKRNYNLMYRTMTGKPVPESVEAFCDTWEMDPEKEQAARQMPVLMREHGVDDYYVEFWRLWMQALRYTQPHLLAYLIYMVERLLQMKVLLKSTGSIFLHCDPTVSHYIKVMMDGVFGHRNFRNEIIWHYGQRTAISRRRFSRKHDVILFYSKSPKTVLNPITQTWKKEEFLARRHDVKTDEDGREFIWTDGGAKGVRYKRMVDDVIAKGKPLDSVWDIPILNSAAKERLGYPTQKPSRLLKRIIKASSNSEDVVFDPFCGCGTTIYSAHELGRSWIGCDIAILAVRLVADTLDARYGLRDDRHYQVTGIPASYDQAVDLFKRDPFQFEHWAVERVGGFPNQKQVADKGIDGRIYFDAPDGLESMVLSVKGGHIKPMDIRELRGVVERDEALMAGYICNREPSKAMLREAAMAGMVQVGEHQYPHVQILTTREMVKGKTFETPTRITSKVRKGQGAFRW